jgi:hypothetical protein
MYYGAEGAVRPAVRQKESPLPPAGNMESEPTSVLTGHLSKGAETTAYLCPNDFCTHGYRIHSEVTRSIIRNS